MERFQVLGKSAFGFLAALLVFTGMATSSHAAEVYDLLFKEGTLDGISRSATLDYQRAVTARDNEKLASRATGTISLSFAPDEMAELQFKQGDKHRNIGSFPATVGNPMIMYFVETVVRDMASTAGGSPFYIRNRVKAALVEKAPIRDETIDVNGHDVPAKTVTLYPFKNDPNRDKMKGFGDLALTVTMSDEVPGWYYKLKAETEGQKGDGSADAKGAPVYSNSIQLATLEVAK